MEHILIILVVVLILGLTLLWVREYGLLRAVGAGVCRALWCLPIVLCLYPMSSMERLPSTISRKVLHVLLDDSNSMKVLRVGSNLTFYELSLDLISRMEDHCKEVSCELEVHTLSSLSDYVTKGYTPLSDVVEKWSNDTATDPRIIITDGGDFRPSLNWGRGISRVDTGNVKSLVVGFVRRNGVSNKWIDYVDVPPISFESKPLRVTVRVKRSEFEHQREFVQLQIAANSTVVSSHNVEFATNQKTANVEVNLPTLAKGQHLIEIKILPTGNENIVWDNRVGVQVESLPNTVGMLHILGSPGWDGRFLRRYLKSEPKFDLISFFILRDPWDNLDLNERESSLIPFPVDRLFTEELAHFRGIILQNFTLSQFLQNPQYQENLVKFVQDGGGLFFIGGARALGSSDLSNSPIREILPFDTDVTTTNNYQNMFDGMLHGYYNRANSSSKNEGPYFDSDIEFKITVPDIDEHARSLAAIYDDLLAHSQEFERVGYLKGLHHTEKVELKKTGVTPLLNAEKRDGTTTPLAVASYPGKGRAVWLFTDTLWRFAMASKDGLPRRTYNDIVSSVLNWILRQDIKKPLVLKNLYLRRVDMNSLKWSVDVSGAASKYFQSNDSWKVEVCNRVLTSSEYIVDRVNSELLYLSGSFDINGSEKVQKCTMNVYGEHPAFGSVRSEIMEFIPELLDDTQVESSELITQILSEVTHSKLLMLQKDKPADVIAWLDQTIGTSEIIPSQEFEVSKDFFWVFKQWWFWLLLCFLPAEVIVRKWERLFSH